MVLSKNDVVPIMEPNKKFLNWSGYWPGGQPRTRNSLFHCIFYICVNIVFVMLPELYFVYKNIDDMVEISQCISEMLSIFLSFFKMLLVLYYWERIRLLVNEMQDTWKENLHYNQIEWQAANKFTEKQSRFMTYIYVCTYVSFGTNFFMNPIITTIIKTKLNGEHITADILPTPIKLDYPYDIKYNMTNFIVTVIFSDIGIFTTISILSAFDAFYLSMINYTASFFEFVNFKINNIETNYDTNATVWPANKINEIMKELSDIVKHHNKAIDFLDRLEEVANIFMIIQYISSTFLFCVVGFQLSIFLENIYQFIRILTYCICLNMQLFTFSWFGSKLMEQCATVADSAYNCDWYNKPIAFQKSMCLIMIRAQRPNGITAAKFYYISLESFSMVLSSSLSYFTLLQTIYEN